mgnify:CR=1 FL=1
METEAEEVAGLKAALAEAEATNERLRVVALAQSEALAKLAESSADGTAATDKGGKGHVSGSDADARINELERRNGVYRRELVHAANELARLRGLRDSLDSVGGLRVLGDGSLTVNADALRVDDPIAGAISSVYVVRMGDSPSSSLTSSALSGSVAREAARRLRVPGKLPFDHKLNPMQLEMHVRLWERVGAELVAENTARKSAAEKLGRRVRALAAELDLAERRLAAYARDAAHPPQPPARNPALEALVAEDELLDELTVQTTRVNTSLQETLDLARKNQRRLAEARVAPSSSPSTARRRSPPEPESSWLSSVDGDEVAAFVEIPSFADMFGNDGALFDEDLASVGEPDPNPDESVTSAGAADRRPPPPTSSPSVGHRLRSLPPGAVSPPVPPLSSGGKRRRFSISFAGTGAAALVRELGASDAPFRSPQSTAISSRLDRRPRHPPVVRREQTQ